MVVGLSKIESVVEEILTFPVKKGLDALKRKKIVIKIIKKLGLDMPGKDATFEQLYAYTLVEVGYSFFSLPHSPNLPNPTFQYPITPCIHAIMQSCTHATTND
jgi:hypothetical protein